MRENIYASRWTCDDCGKEVCLFTHQYPEGWDEVDDNPKGECQDICEECLKNHVII